jgi:hypothetical protein
MEQNNFHIATQSRESLQSLLFLHNEEANLTLKWIKYALAVFVLLALFAMSGNPVFVALEIFAGVLVVLLQVHFKAVDIHSKIVAVALCVAEKDKI